MVTQEYKNTRGLLPIKINILGPPGVGKTTIAKALAAHYRIHHVTAATMIADAKTQLEEIVARGDQPAQEKRYIFYCFICNFRSLF